MSSFIFFGCWNNINCSKNEKILNRNLVLELLNKLFKNSKIILAGDNWYAHKKKTVFKELVTSLLADRSSIAKSVGSLQSNKKTLIDTKTRNARSLSGVKTKKRFVYNYVTAESDKTANYSKYYPLKILESGYKLLFDISKNIDIVLGNHDVNPIKVTDFYEHDNCDELGCMVTVQNDIIGKLLNNQKTSNNIRSSSIKNIYTYNNVNIYVCRPYIRQQENGIFYLYLNTNIFDAKDPMHIIEYCNLVEQTLLEQKKIKLLFVVGHHPFAGIKKSKDKTEGYIVNSVSKLYFKKSKDKSKDKTDKSEDKSEDKKKAIYYLLDIISKYKSIYLCADIHNFQIGKLTNNTCMIICGTGGANKDRLGYYDGLPTPTDGDLDFKYKISDLYTHNSHGFSKISYSSDGNAVNVIYYKINNTDIKYTECLYTLTYNDSWSISKKDETINTIETDKDFSTKQACKELRALEDVQVNKLIANVDGIGCGKK
jgi:hypothetical protein